jgi:hypothetical protein
MAVRRGIAGSVFASSEMSTGRAVTEVMVSLGKGYTAFYIAPDGPQPKMGDALEWGTNHVTVRRPDGETFTVRKIGYDFDPMAPLH